MRQKSRALSIVPIRRDQVQILLRTVDYRGIAPKTGDSHNPVTNAERLHRGADADHFTGKLKPGNKAAFRGRGIQSGQGKNVGEVQAHRGDLHTYIMSAEIRQ